MRTHELILDELQNPKDAVDVLKERGLQEGDTVKVVADDKLKPELLILILFALAAVVVYFLDKKKRQDEGEAILKDLFKGKPVEEIEKEIEAEYGINIEIEHRMDEDRQFWKAAAAKSMARAYGDDEPDYSDVPLMEPNPSYKKWSKDQS